MCQSLLTHLEPLVLKGQSESDFIAEANEACKVLPATMTIGCQQLVSMNARELRYTLRAGKGATAACDLVGFCGTSKTSHARLSGAPTGFFCDICQDIVQYIEKLLLEDFLEADIEILVGDFCNLLPSPISSWCISFIDQNLEEIIAALEADIDAFNICGQIGICDTANPRGLVHLPVFKTTVSKKVGDGPFCDTCKSIIDYVRQLYIDGYAKDQIEALLNEICNDLGPLASLCIQYVDQFIDQVFDWIDQELDSDTICSLIGLCQAPSRKQAPRLPHAKSGKKMPTGLLCNACENLIYYIRTLLLDGLAKEAIEAAVAAVCEALGPFAPLCTSFIDQYIDDIFAWIDQGLNETEICTELGLCTFLAQKSTRRGFTMKAMKGIKTDGFCDLCIDLIDYIRGLVIDDFAKEEIEDLLNGLCNDLPSPFSALCTSVVDQFIDDIFAWIDQELDSQTICGLIGLCSTGKKTARHANLNKGRMTTLPTGIICDTCKELIDYVRKLVLDGLAKDAIEGLVADFCNQYPAPIGTFCLAIVDQAIDEIFDLVDQGIDSFDICGKIGICDSARVKIPNAAPLKMEAVSPCARNPALCARKARRPVIKVQ